MLCLSRTANMPLDRHVVGGIGKDHSGLLVSHEILDNRCIQSIPTDQSMITKLPEVTRFATLRHCIEFGNIIIAWIAWILRLDRIE